MYINIIYNIYSGITPVFIYTVLYVLYGTREDDYNYLKIIFIYNIFMTCMHYVTSLRILRLYKYYIYYYYYYSMVIIIILLY